MIRQTSLHKMRRVREFVLSVSDLSFDRLATMLNVSRHTVAAAAIGEGMPYEKCDDCGSRVVMPCLRCRDQRRRLKQ